jgi:hypothetical protein
MLQMPPHRLNAARPDRHVQRRFSRQIRNAGPFKHTCPYESVTNRRCHKRLTVRARGEKLLTDIYGAFGTTQLAAIDRLHLRFVSTYSRSLRFRRTGANLVSPGEESRACPTYDCRQLTCRRRQSRRVLTFQPYCPVHEPTSSKSLTSGLPGYDATDRARTTYIQRWKERIPSLRLEWLPRESDCDHWLVLASCGELSPPAAGRLLALVAACQGAAKSKSTKRLEKATRKLLSLDHVKFV